MPRPTAHTASLEDNGSGMRLRLISHKTIKTYFKPKAMGNGRVTQVDERRSRMGRALKLSCVILNPQIKSNRLQGRFYNQCMNVRIKHPLISTINVRSNRHNNNRHTFPRDALGVLLGEWREVRDAY